MQVKVRQYASTSKYFSISRVCQSPSLYQEYVNTTWKFVISTTKYLIMSRVRQYVKSMSIIQRYVITSTVCLNVNGTSNLIHCINVCQYDKLRQYVQYSSTLKYATSMSGVRQSMSFLRASLAVVLQSASVLRESTSVIRQTIPLLRQQ